MAVLLLVAVTLWQRRRAVRQKLANQAALQAAHDSLESTVVARTAQLRAAQGELVHAGKMAALGQMSAGMVHELNQPLTAMRTLSDSAGILLDKSRLDDVRGNLQRIRGMVDRLARLTSQLKTFAHKSELPLRRRCRWRAASPTRRRIVRRSRKEARHRASRSTCSRASLSVMAEEAALGSVLVNLMRNAIDAMQDAPQRTLRIEARPHGRPRDPARQRHRAGHPRRTSCRACSSPSSPASRRAPGLGPGPGDLGTIGARHGRHPARRQPARKAAPASSSTCRCRAAS